MMSRRVLPAMLVIAAACTSADADAGKVTVDTLPGGIVQTVSQSPVDSGRWHLVLDHAVQPAEGAPGELMDPEDVSMTDDGTLLVAERNPREVKVFDANGKYVRSIGRDGEGPGEFRTAWIAVRGDTLVLQDPRSTRGSTFLITTGAFVNSRVTACCYYYPISIDGSGRGVARAMFAPDSGAPPSQGFVRFTLGTSVVDTARVPIRPEDASGPRWVVGEGNRIRFSRPIPLRPADVHAVDRTGGFVTGWSGEYRLRLTRNGTDTVAIFGRAHTPEPVTAAQKQAIVDAVITQHLANDTDTPEDVLRKAFNPTDIPDQRPAFEAVSTDPAGRRWVRLSTGDTTIARIDLFDNAGRWLDQLILPIEGWTKNTYDPVAISRDRAAVIGEDPQGRPLVYVYRIEKFSTGK